MSSRLPAAVRTLIREHVQSVGELELLMLLHGERDREWTAQELCDALQCPPTWADERLAAMTAAGLVSGDGTRWRYAPRTEELDAATGALEDAYRVQTRDVVRFIFASPVDDLHAFSDAFRVRRDEER